MWTVRELSPRRGRKILIYFSNLITFSWKNSKSHHARSLSARQSSLHRIFPETVTPPFESLIFYLGLVQFLSNSDRYVLRYHQFCEIFDQICHGHVAPRFAPVLLSKVLLFDLRKHSPSLQAIFDAGGKPSTKCTARGPVEPFTLKHLNRHSKQNLKN